MQKVIVRLRGGIGNQLFCYAAARRLALVNDAELVLDAVSGFSRDQIYHRKYGLEKFMINARLAAPNERFQPFERPRRSVARFASQLRPFENRYYIQEEGMSFDPRLLNVRSKAVYLDGYWQSERYFADVSSAIRDDLRIKPPSDRVNRELAELIRGTESACLHVRWFETPDSRGPGKWNLALEYYQSAILALEGRVGKVHYFIFSDDPIAAAEKLGLPADRAVAVQHNRGDGNAAYDLWLMTQCRHFIIANSTFSWWGAWLGTVPSTTVIAPARQTRGMTAWGFEGLLPDTWIAV